MCENGYKDYFNNEGAVDWQFSMVNAARNPNDAYLDETTFDVFNNFKTLLSENVISYKQSKINKQEGGSFCFIMAELSKHTEMFTSDLE